MVPSSNLVSSPQQETPLHWAATGGHKDIVKYIIQAGADVNIKDNRGVSKTIVLTVDYYIKNNEDVSELVVECSSH